MSLPRLRASVGRADLLRMLCVAAPAIGEASNPLVWFGLPGLNLADEPGFLRRPEVRGQHFAEPETPPLLGQARPQASSSAAPLQMSHAWVCDTSSAPKSPDPQGQVAEQPLLSPTHELTRPDPGVVLSYALAVRERPVLTQARLKALLRPGLQQRVKRQPDWAELARRLARRQALYPLPMQQRTRWPAHLVLLLDRQARSMSPFVHDMDMLAQRLRRWLGHRAVEVAVLSAKPAHPWGAWRADPAQLPAPQAARLAEACVLLVSDLGVNLAETPTGLQAVPSQRTAEFAQWLQHVAHQRARVLHLAPLPLSAWPVAKVVRPALVGQVVWSGALQAAGPGAKGEPAGLQLLLALLALWGQMSDVLLRACRQCLPQGAMDATLEWQLWNHPDVQGQGRWLSLQPSAQARHQARLAQWPVDGLVRMTEVQHALMAGSSAADLHLDCLRSVALAPVLQPALTGLHTEARHYLREVLPQQWRQAQGAKRRQLAAQMAQLVGLAPGEVLRQERPAFRQLAAMAYDEALRRQEPVPVPAALGSVEPLGTPAETSQPARVWRLAQTGTWLTLQRADANQGAALTPPMLLNALEEVVLRLGSAVQWCAVQGAVTPLVNLQTVLEPRFEVQLGEVVVVVSQLVRPRWAVAWGRRRDQLMADFELPWGAVGTAVLDKNGVQWRMPDNRFGVDDWGLFFDLAVPSNQGDVVQRFRWIAPGSFLMGSPKTEPQRFDNEGPQHRVKLTQGFWLADTACTQALWLAVVGGKNPSHFKGDDELPLEKVSWNNVMKEFMPKLQALLPEGVEATLPSEAQWEYACRAGTSTAYVWGDEMNSELANIDTRQTTPVKTYPANPWGLFDMHGNVLEWCFDGLRTYEDAEAVDPLGAVGDGPRALRGGSWRLNAWVARSAYRYEDDRGRRDGTLGFRLALRFKPSQGAEPQGIGAGGPGIQRPEASQAEPGALRRGGATTPVQAEPKPDGREAAARKNGVSEVWEKIRKVFKSS